ncbi:MAG: hypothetical protein LBS23_02485 [Holosporaceae bacterium]|jgi:hypothetical protein|nr:hypothetical protein [Holosporaceae bacterium]
MVLKIGQKDMTNPLGGAYEATKQGDSTSSINCTIETKGPDDIFSSEIKDRENAAPCDHELFACQRLASSNIAAGEMPNFGDIINGDPEIRMLYGSWAPGIQRALLDGTTIEFIIIRRVMNIKNKIEDIQVITYGSCLIKTYRQEGDEIIFSFSWETREDRNLARQRDGQMLGQFAVLYNSATGETTYNDS